MKHTFPTLEVASAATGVALCLTTFSRMQEIFEAVLGHPVWTHELAHEATVAKLRARVDELFPEMPTRAEAEGDYEKAAEKALAAYGEEVSFLAIKRSRSTGPVSTLCDMRPDLVARAEG